MSTLGQISPINSSRHSTRFVQIKAKEIKEKGESKNGTKKEEMEELFKK